MGVDGGGLVEEGMRVGVGVGVGLGAVSEPERKLMITLLQGGIKRLKDVGD